MVTIVDYDIGNLASVANMLKHKGVPCEITNNGDTLLRAEKLVLPGVGAFDTAMKQLRELNLIESLQQFAKSGKPMLGICLGAQLLMQSSEEGKLPGLGLVEGTCKLFTGISPLRVPHMGWAEVEFKSSHALFKFDSEIPRFYFTHSYYLQCNNCVDIAGKVIYGVEFAAAIRKNNVFGVQFHPEKSHRFGARLLQNFAEL